MSKQDEEILHPAVAISAYEYCRLKQAEKDLESENKELNELLEEAVTCFGISDPCKFLEDNKAKLDKLLNK